MPTDPGSIQASNWRRFVRLFRREVVSQLARNWRSVNPGLLREPVNPSVWCVHQEV
ncbi:hypothetical protein NEUTE1DRAFT_116712 [Neurospora tetrasperma FGSC 2508]|uniref:Uncharacterized protein n=1 Tax=Neurospora tetrasperma (strain FGSC 2508 / ATCC MYA-4615 / P0657) TaxID=510951 RepID=F8MJG1_NEUT8|nr:uncharacterized protein NEUTE1DRAFT_116712 [Neurospora tetrasperma FGSC 2508]EGO59952.1 hypothetical protein NEUTE1DRAFT_116712 [Neurospora tetrasperma FGSC 2508]EGZ74102.1 hypothetical protein NEUTE2DRAFT_144405 [Neurospora tetrasperma FGSC 2509]